MTASPDYVVVDCVQGSEEWLQARVGRVTGSRASAITAELKRGGVPAVRLDYCTELAIERLTGVPAEDGFVSADMLRGKALEATAIARYEGLVGRIVRRTGFVVSLREPFIGVSLDGDTDNFTTLVEVKCPKMKTHIGYLKAGVLPSEYVPQLLHGLTVIPTAQQVDFVSFDPRMPVDLQLFAVRVTRDALSAQLEKYGEQLDTFLDEVDREYQALRALRGRGGRP